MSTDNNEKTTLFVMAFLLAGVEKFIPVIPILPWLKIGLFHSITMIWIYKFGLLDALAFVFVRQWVIMSFFGFSPLPFLLGTSGAVFSVIFGAALIKSNKFGIIAIGIFCAIIHNITQLFVLYAVMSGNFVWQWQLPIMLVASLFTGAVTGLLAYKINKTPIDFCNKKDYDDRDFKNSFNIFGILSFLLALIATCIFENYVFYAVLFLLILVISRKINCEIPSFSQFFARYGIFLFALYLSSLFSQKIQLYHIRFWTNPLIFVSKISLWFLFAPFFQKFGFYRLFYAILLKIFPKKFSQTLSVGAIMPQIFPNVLQEIPLFIKSFFKSPKNAAEILVKKSQEILSDWEK